jgi:ribulose-5-phosphate 4-epimerase/fuculose-1-phosphate aldolase
VLHYSAEVLELRRLSASIGSNLNFVQGPGGNTSYKHGEFIWVKASGTKLADAMSKEIFVQLDLHSGIVTPSSQILAPSIESELHREINSKVVIHTHSTAAIILGFRNDREKLLEFFGRTVVIPYARPGRELAKSIKDFVDTSVHDFAILKNHGLVVWGESVGEAEKKLYQFESHFQKLTEYSKFQLKAAGQALTVGNLNKYLTPDHAVFLDATTLSQMSQSQSLPRWLGDMFNQLAIVLASSSDSKNLSWLSEEEVCALRSWESEKKRKEINN